jgi:hypothetical protein
MQYVRGFTVTLLLAVLLPLHALAGIQYGHWTLERARLEPPEEPKKHDIQWYNERTWAGRENDSGAVHVLGNGRLCVYEQGPDIIQVFGPPYSATTIGRIELEGEGLSCFSRRIQGTGIWKHEIVRDGKLIATLADFVEPWIDCFSRVIYAAETVTFVFSPEPDLRLANYSRANQIENFSLLIETPIGKPLVPFGRYPLPFAIFNQLTLEGEAKATRSEKGVRVVCAPGCSILRVGGGLDCFDVGAEHPDWIDVFRLSCSDSLERSLLYTTHSWNMFARQGRDFATELPPDVPMRERLVEVLDSVAVLIKAQQAKEGGVLAGYPYHLGYVRDQYGTHRGLVALGHEEMSRDILQFYFDVFERGGMIRNAQAFGMPGVYHVHENDDVEITGYITLQAFDYFEQSGDAEFLTEIFPMLEWAFEAQRKHLVKGMLPFNGDETYVAGGILPRSALNDGSAEATMLFIESGAKLIDFAEAHTRWSAERAAEAREVVAEVRRRYRDNFWRDGRLITNNPARATVAKMPKTRHGVCERCTTVHDTLRTPNGRYVCVECLDEEPLPPVTPEIYTLQSVSLTPLYFNSTLFDKEEMRPLVEEIMTRYEATGELPSRPDGKVSVGYDYGLLLYALTELGDPRARDLYIKTLELADETGAWAEYYTGHVPAGTRCRPWESAINVEALLHWVDTEYEEERGE